MTEDIDRAGVAATSGSALEPGGDAWLSALGAAARTYHGDPFTIDVVVSGDRSGGGFAYHVELRDGLPPQFRAGLAGAGSSSATLELSRSEIEAQQRGLPAVVSYMRGTAKTKGATRPLYELFRLLA